MQRASYQKPFATKIQPKARQACLCFKTPDGAIFKPLDDKNLRIVTRFWPELTLASLLIALINGKSFVISGNTIVSIAYK